MKKHLSAAFAFVMAAVLTGCGSSSSSSSSQAVTTAPATTAETTAASETEAASETAENTEGGVNMDQNGYKHYPTPEDVNDFTGVDFSGPDITVAYGEFDKMTELAKSIQSYTLEGVVVDIDGIVNSGMSHSIQMPNEDGSKSIGTTIQVIGFEDSDYPADKTRVHITGIIRPLNEYVHIIYVPKDNFKVVE